MTIPGMGMYSAMLLLSDIGDNKKPAAVARVALARATGSVTNLR